MQIIQYDIMDASEKIVEKIKIKVNDNIRLEKYDGNDINILEINQDNIKISRDAVRYEIISQTSLLSGENKRYTENVVEEIAYEELLLILRIRLDQNISKLDIIIR